MSDNDIALERREAQGSHAEGPRAPGPPPPQDLGPGSSARDAGRSQGRRREPRKLPGASRRSNPSFGGKGKRDTGHPGAPEAKAPERRSVG